MPDLEKEGKTTNEPENPLVLFDKRLKTLMLLTSIILATLGVLIALNAISGFYHEKFISSGLPANFASKLEELVNSGDYEGANLMVLNLLRNHPDNTQLYDEYVKFLEHLIRINDITRVRNILNDSTVIITKLLSEVPDQHFNNVYRFASAVQEASEKHLKQLYEVAATWEANGEHESVDNLVNGYVYEITSNQKVCIKFLELLHDRLETLASSATPTQTLDLAYSTFDSAVSLVDGLKNRYPVADYQEIDLIIAEMAGYLNDIEYQYGAVVASETTISLRKMSEEISKLEALDDETYARGQLLLIQAHEQLQNMFIHPDQKKDLLKEISNLQDLIVEKKSLDSKSKIKEYNRWAFNMLKTIDPEKVRKDGYLNLYANFLGEIDKNYLYPEVAIYYDHLMSKLIEKMRTEEIEKFVEKMLSQEKRQP
ncbi:MAG TPA: hypothetical protein DHV12_01685 [Thermotogae bacterium]|nr:hypothetical protein [Thermotogota bacterium]